MLGLLIPLLLPDLLPKLDEESARTFAEWFGHRRLLLLPILIVLGAAYYILSHRYVILHQEPDSIASIQASSQLASSKQDEKENEERRLEMLHHLSGDEKELLQMHLAKDKRCIHHSMGEGAAPGLEARGILYFPSQQDVQPRWEAPRVLYCVSDWAWTYLKQHPRLLK